MKQPLIRRYLTLALLLASIGTGCVNFDAGRTTNERQDYATELRKIRSIAEQGDVEMQVALGAMYQLGLGVAQDYNTAFKWYRKAAEQEHAGAQHLLGSMYRNGQGVAQDYKAAFKWISKAAEQGNADAQHFLGSMYRNGQGVAQDYKAAMQWYSKAAQQGNFSAQFMLGFMYFLGQDVAQDYKAAFKWSSKAAEQYRQLVEQGFTEKEITEGLGELDDLGMQLDLKAAFKQGIKVFQQMNAFVQIILGEMYEEGQGVAQDYKAAMQWYSKAAEQGEALAQNNLGLMYKNGHGVAQDYKAAFKWFSKAAEQGFTEKEITEALGGLEEALGEFSMSQDFKAAVQWFSELTQQGQAEAQLNLGSMYENGKGVPQDKIRAHMWFNLAASNGAGAGARDRVAAGMTPAEIKKAQSLASDCLAKNYQDC